MNSHDILLQILSKFVRKLLSSIRFKQNVSEYVLISNVRSLLFECLNISGGRI